jgi:type IV pilus assembly protein PilY1
MNPFCKVALRGALITSLSAGLWPGAGSVQAQALNFAQTPLFLGTTVKPNVLVVYDNSQSMDGTMAGRLIAGDDDSTRGNIARSVLRSTITTYRNTFNWGLASFELSSTNLRTIYPYYMGSDTEVLYTNDCVAGISASNAGLRCIANPDPTNANGHSHITYKRASDDADINDVLYTSDNGPDIYGIGVNNTNNYSLYFNRDATTNWAAANFSSFWFTGGFTPTDAGFLPGTFPANPAMNLPRIFFIKRAWGYTGGISGAGRINQGVASADTTPAAAASQYTSLMALLAKETNTASGELKNAATYTPLAGTLGTVRDYFRNNVSGKPTPITQSCQKNFVLLATDGNPTGRTNGTMYTLAEMANTFNAGTGTWTFGTASNDVFTRVTALRTTNYSGTDYDVQTYVVGLGDSVANPSSIATLNQMAKLGGTDAAYLASDQTALANAFRAISVDIISRTAAASSVSLNSGSWNTGAKVYQGRFSSADWAGQLLAFPIGATGDPAAAPDWDAAQRLNAQDWNTGRQIITYKPSGSLGSRGVPFRWPANPGAPGAGEIDAGLVSALNKNGSGTTDGFGAQRLEFLRGSAAREERNCAACAAPVFRNRATSVLGDIVNSAPVFVGGATGEYRDTMEASRYSTYASSRSGHTPMLYVGANDGMLHAFNANTGSESFAYVPWAVRNRLSSLTSNPYVHQFTVDGSPSVGDVHYGGGWKTLLVAGMNAGAPGLYALDVTNPANFTEANAAQVVRWEIGDSDADVGHIFGRPILAKMKDGRWRAIVGNGYNSANGHAVLLLVDLETGTISRIDTGSGSAGTPNGLSAVAVVSSADNGVADLVYAGDLYGNVWKFDLSATTPAGWKVAYGTAGAPLPLFTAASGQAITARPDVTRFPKGGYLVAVGSGRYVDVSDNSVGGTQTVYGLWDNGAPVTLASLQTQAVVKTVTGTNGRTYRQSTFAVGTPADTVLPGDSAITLNDYYSSKMGWKLDLPTSGERVVTEAAVRNGRLVISTLIPSTAVCSFGGDGWIMDVDIVTGNRAAALDTNGDNLVNSGDAIGGTVVSGVQVGAVPAAATIIRGSGQFKKSEFKMVNTSNGSIVRVPEAGNPAVSRRAAWEQIQ